MQVYVCTGCSDYPCYYLTNDDVDDAPEMCPYGDIAVWQAIDIEDIIDVLETR